jgi:hypothetical protein
VPLFRRFLPALAGLAMSGITPVVGLTLSRVAPAAAGRVAGSTLHAQAVAGIGDDAIPLPARGWRLSTGAQWDQWDRRLSGSARTPLLAPLGTAALGAAQLPALQPIEEGLRSLLGGDYSLTLGPLEASGAVRRSTALLQAEFGLTRRVSLAVRVPYVEVRHAAQLVLNRAGTDANVGENPARRSSQALISNGRVYTTLSAASSALTERLTACAGDPAGEGCDVVLRDPGAAAQLVARATAFAAAWRRVYGDGTHGGGPVVPHVASAAHAALGRELAGLSGAFARYGTTTVPDAVPAGATAVYGSLGLQALVRDSAFGVNADSLDRAFRAGMGDVELEARVLLFDSWRGSQAARLATTHPGVRVLAAAGWRFGSSSSAQAAQPFALATGAEVSAVLLRATADLVWKRWAWMSASVRATLPQADRAVVRLPGVGLPDAFLAGTPTVVSRQLGPHVDLELTPRLSLGENLGVAASLVHRSLGPDAYRATDGTREERTGGSAQYATIGVTYSTLAPYVRGKSTLALEVSFLHEVALAARGTSVPSLVRDRVELRVYPGFPRR